MNGRLSGLPRRGKGALLLAAGLLAGFCALSGCGRPAPDRVQGYVEGEFVYVGSPLAGTLTDLLVERGRWVKAGEPLFSLESAPEKEARDEARRRLAQARASLADVRKGRRPSEIAALEAQLGQARAALTLSEKELARQERLLAAGAVAAQAADRARAARDQDSQRAAQIEAELATARLGARRDQVAAAEDNARALEAALARAEWSLSQKRQAAPQAGRVFDTLFRPGEWVPAGRPVVVLLPPRNVKVRAFVPQARVGALRLGQPVRVAVDGAREEYAGRVSFISPRAEYTPPVVYSRESREKLVFMVEASFDPGVAADLHPGQPVDVRFGP
jgi:HlyD family secretion protein